MKLKLIFLILLITTLCHFMLESAPTQSESGTIKFEVHPSVGKQTDWESIFYDTYKCLAVGPDGYCYVSNGRQHSIYKFSPQGKLVKQFGRKGRGPGDLYAPGDISILDNKYLVVGEYASLRRLSVFDLNGKFVKVVKTSRLTFAPLALKNNRVAYMTSKDKGRAVAKHSVYIIDISTGKEILVTSEDIVNTNVIRSSQNAAIMLASQIGDVIIERTINGNLCVGVSNTPKISIYSPEGKLLRTFQLDMQPIKVTKSYIDTFKKKIVDSMVAENSDPTYLKSVKKTNFKLLFTRHFPFYKDIIIDAEGNLIVIKWLDSFDDGLKVARVFSDKGKFLYEGKIDCGKYSFDISRHRRHLVFSQKGIFGLFQLKGSEDISLRLVKLQMSTPIVTKEK